MPDLDPTNVRCPTCRARQAWSDTCRRCKCDLRLLRAADQAYRHNHVQCLHALRAGKSYAALGHARICVRLSPDDESHRLLAVCALLNGDWTTVLAVAGNHPEARHDDRLNGRFSDAQDAGDGQ